MKIAKLLFVAILLLFLSRKHNLAGRAQTDISPPRPFIPFESEGIQYLRQSNTNQRNFNPPLLEGEDPLLDWSDLYYQSIRDGNWNIYRAKHNYNGEEIQLTFHSGHDIYPRCNKGCSDVAFVSNRTGNFELFTMSSGGSNLTQLTHHWENDFNPDWSPDGAKIVFNSYREENQSDIYVIHKISGDITRLTSHSAYDGEAVWSPDGSQILFTSTRTNVPELWVMNADGSDKRQLTNMPFSQSAAWSPDGEHIAFSSDEDKNGWLEAWVMDKDGTNMVRLYSSMEPNTDILVRGWSPNGKRVTYTKIKYILYQNNLYWVSAKIAAISVFSNSYFNQYLNSRETDWYPQWVSNDANPPVSLVAPLHPFTKGEAHIKWNGEDVGNAGIESFDIFYRGETDNQWLQWFTDTRKNDALFEGNPGETYFFNSQSIDNAFNQEDFPQQADASTTFYNWSIAGSVFDNRYTPLSNANVQTSPASFVSSPTDSKGDFALFSASNSAFHTANWDKSGYGLLPTTIYSNAQDIQANFILPPADNILANSHFEGDDNWQVSSDISPTISERAAHTGSRGVILGQPLELSFPIDIAPGVSNAIPYGYAKSDDGIIYVILGYNDLYLQKMEDGQWGAPELLPTPVGHLRYVEVDSNGTIHLITAKTDSTTYYHTRTSDGTWEIELIPFINTFNVSATLGKDGSTHVVWEKINNPYSIYYANRSVDGNWSEPKHISETYSFDNASLITDKDGNVHFIWNGGDGKMYYRQINASGVWLPQQLVAEMFVYSTIELALNNAGEVYIIWKGKSSEGLEDQLYFALAQNNSVSIPHKLTAEPTQLITGDYVVDSKGNLHLIWTIYDSELHRYLPVYAIYDASEDTWSPISTIPISTQWFSPQLAISKSDTLHLIWKIDDAFYYKQKPPNSHWSAELVMTHPFSSFSDNMIFVDNNETPYVLWRGHDGDNNRAFQTTIAQATQAGYSRIQQAVFIPTSLGNPTLSFLYELKGQLDDGNNFQVEIQDNTQSTVLLSPKTHTAGWTHAWGDLSSWAGQSVTITFATEQVTDTVPINAYLDEVTIGSAHSDVWVDLAALHSAYLPGNSVMYQLCYGNQGGVDAHNVEIRLNLPSELEFVDATLNPDSIFPDLVWNIGSIAAGNSPACLNISTVLSESTEHLDEIISSVSATSLPAELQQENNNDSESFLIATMIYLPIIEK